MHIPENYLSPLTCGILTLVMIPFWRRATKNLKKEINHKKLPLIGIGAAFSFIIMMFNIPLPGGTSGHAIGGAILAILLGPNIALIIMSVVLFLQSIFFGDGGILAFGANCFNMALVIPFVAHFIFKSLKVQFKNSLKGEKIAAFLAGYISLNIAALTTAIELGIQPIFFVDSKGLPLYAPYGLNITIPGLLIPHLLVIGIIEGVITCSVYSYLKKTSFDILEKDDSKVILKPYIGLFSILILLTPLGLLASGSSWGEWSPDKLKELIGYIPNGIKNGFLHTSIMQDYAFYNLNKAISYILAAISGIIFCILIGNVIENIVKKRINKN